jgi:3-oxoacyl-[acyl-carrier protein] reductase
LRFAKEGAVVVVADLNEDAAASVAAEIASAGGTAFAIQMDIADPISVGRAVTAAFESAGTINVLSNTAGMYDGGMHTLQTSSALWDKVIAVNLTGMFQVTKAILPRMIEHGGGVVLNISSGAGLRGGAGGTAYTASKHGVVGFTSQLAAEYGAKGIRAVGIAPGLIDTPMVSHLTADPAFLARVAMRPAGRMGTPEDIANAALFLVSDESDYVHGVTLAVDGGRFAVF